MLLFLNEKKIIPNIVCNKFDFQPYLSTYKNNPLDNFKNVSNVSLKTSGGVLVSEILTPKTKEESVLVYSNFNEKHISAVKGKINHKPIADFEYTFEDGDIVLNNLSTDPDDDTLNYRWSISDDVNFDSKNVKYTFQHKGLHTITLVASDGELSDTKTITLTTDNAEGYSEYILIDMDISQEGNVFTIEDVSTAKNVYSYEREWYLDGEPLTDKSSKITLTVNDRNKHKVGLKCTAGKFTDFKENFIYAILEPVISAKVITITKGQSVELSGENSYSVDDPIKSYMWYKEE